VAFTESIGLGKKGIGSMFATEFVTLGTGRGRRREVAGSRIRVEELESRCVLSTTTFAVIGDYGDAGPNEAAVADLVKSWSPDMVVTVGDNNYDVGSAATIDANIGQYYQEFIGNYTGSYGAGSPTNRFFPTLGNHDWGTANAQPYLDYFDLPGDGYTNSSGNERYYDFVEGPVHFFMLDSDSQEPDGITAQSVQAQWLQTQLAASTSLYQVVLLHHAPYSSGSHGSNTTLQWPFQLWGADVVLAGHDHTYERIDVNGLPYIVNGLGGRSLYGFGTPVAGSQVSYSDNYGAMLVSADTTSMVLKFYSVASGGTEIDSMTITAPVDTTAPTATLVAPLDNSARDVNPAIGSVTTGFGQDEFAIQLADDLIGVDDNTVTTSSVSVMQDGVALVAGTDYSFTYDAAADRISLTPIGEFSEASYVIELSGIQDVSGNVLSPTSFNITIDYSQANSFTLALLPDTQYYSQSYPETFEAQTQWIVEHLRTDNIAFVSHVGDLVQNGGQSQLEWDRADVAMSTLDGQVPYGAVIGNHDYDTVSSHASATKYVQYFGAGRYAGQSWYLGSSADQLNHAQTFTSQGTQFLHLTLEWEPRDSSIAWAQSMIDANPSLPVILTTHAYLNASGNRFTSTTTADGNSGEAIYQQLVRPNPQVFLVLNGHFSGEAHRVSPNNLGQDVIEILADYQDEANGGDGWMQLLEFLPEENRIAVRTYSPTLDQFETDANSQFSFPLNFAERFDFTYPPRADLLSPLDGGPNDLNNVDNQATVNEQPSVIQVQLSDLNDSIDDGSVIASAITVTKDGVPWTESLQYSFAYDAVTDVISLSSLAGSFSNGEYEIILSGGIDRISDVGGVSMPATTLRVVVDTSIQFPQTLTFRQNVGGYVGTIDTYIQEANSGANNATATSLNVDGDDPAGSGNDVQALMRFENIFGTGAGQIPAGSQVLSATLQLQVTNGGNSVAFHRLGQNWSDSTSWSGWGSGVQADGTEAVATADAVTGGIPTGAVTIDVGTSLTAWAGDPSSNYGWAILPLGTDGIDFHSAQGTTPPLLTVTYIPPSPEPTPNAADDFYTLDEDSGATALTPPLVSNDSFGEDGPAAVAIAIASGPTHGVAVVLDGGTPNDPTDDTVQYTPEPNFHGTDQFIYRIEDGNGDTSSATVWITVNPVDDLPVAQADGYILLEDSVANTLTVLGNDSFGGDGAALVPLSIVQMPAHGTAQVDDQGTPDPSDDTIQYTPATNYFGSDTLIYQIQDFDGDVSTATVSIQVTSVDDFPQTVADSYVVPFDSPLTSLTPAVTANDDFGGDGAGLSAIEITVPPIGGIATVNDNNTPSDPSDDTIDYLPNAGFSGMDMMTYQITDSDGDVSSATITIAVTALPAAADDQYTMTEDAGPIVLLPRVVDNDTFGGDGPGIAPIVIVSGPAHGVAMVLDGGTPNDPTDDTVQYAPAPDYFGMDQLTYRIEDSTGDISEASVTITVLAVNDLPMIFDDAYIVQRDSVLSVVAPGVLMNDTDIEGDLLLASVVSNASHGNVVLQVDGSFVYVPEPGFIGEDIFTYVASDGTGQSSEATVTISVIASNEAPIARNDAYATRENEPLIIASPGILANDNDGDGDPLTVILENAPSNGALTLNEDGSFTYTPAPDSFGIDTFRYRAWDGREYSDAATVTITVNPLDRVTSDLPRQGTIVGSYIDTYASDNVSQSIQESLYGGGRRSRLDHTWQANIAGGGQVTFVLEGRRSASSAESFYLQFSLDRVNWTPMFVIANATDTVYSYAMPSGLSGTVYVQVLDDLNFDNGVADTVFIDEIYFESSIGPTNAIPIAADDNYAATEDTLLSVPATGVLANDTDDDSDPLVAILDGAPLYGTLAISQDGSFTYLPDPDFHGTDSFTYVAYDGTSSSNIATVVITVGATNDLPVAVDDSFGTSANTLLSIDAPGILANDSDVDGDGLSASLVDTVLHGTLTLSADGAFDYLPNVGFIGVDSFTYRASDGTGASNLATMSITVAEANIAPVAINDGYATDEDVPLVIQPVNGILANDSDANGHPLTAVLDSGPAHGSLTLNPDGSFTYLPEANFNGSDEFTYHASDGIDDSNIAVVTIIVNSVNDTPSAADDVSSMTQDSAITIDVLQNDSDVDGNLVSNSIVVTVNPANGIAVANADGTITYAPNATFHGEDSFYYTVQDNDGALSNEAKVTVSVTSLGTKFFVVDDNVDVTFEYNPSVELVEQSSLTSANASPRGVTSNVDGSLVWVVDAGGTVFVYDNDGIVQGSWIAEGVQSAEGIATDGTDVWVVDGSGKKLLRYAGAATRLNGSARPTTRTGLGGQANPKGVTTNGTNLWIVDDGATVDQVMLYSTTMSLLGTWEIGGGTTSPTGITINPAGGDDLWIVDAGVNQVLEFRGGAALTSGSHPPTLSYALAPGNAAPEGIADPVPRDGSVSVSLESTVPVPTLSITSTTSSVDKLPHQVVPQHGSERASVTLELITQLSLQRRARRVSVLAIDAALREENGDHEQTRTLTEPICHWLDDELLDLLS
jgi:VCBS repeat-containing protein